MISQSTKPQPDRFREAASALECDDDEARFDAKLKKVVRAQKPKDPTQEDAANG